MKNSPKCLQLLLIWCDINACCLTVFPLTLITELLWLTMPSARPSDIFFTRIYRHLWINDALLWCHRKFHVWKRYQTTRKPIILFVKKVPKCSYWRTRQFISETGISFCVITTRSRPWLPNTFVLSEVAGIKEIYKKRPLAPGPWCTSKSIFWMLRAKSPVWKSNRLLPSFLLKEVWFGFFFNQIQHCQLA